MDDWEGLTDEEIARRLQEQFEKEDALLNVVGTQEAGETALPSTETLATVGGDGEVKASRKILVDEDEDEDEEKEQEGITKPQPLQQDPLLEVEKKLDIVDKGKEEEDEDTRLARLLQEEFDNESTIGAADEELARALQNEFLTEPTYSPAPSPVSLHTPTLFPTYGTGNLTHNTSYGGDESNEYTYVPSPPLEMPKKQPKEPKNTSRGAVQRLIKDFQGVRNLKNPNIYIHSHENDITQVEALIIGPEDTPYAGGMFHFQMDFPADYPWSPPKVELITTDYGKCRFNPNLYACGKGTWTGPAWTAVQTCLSTLQSIQSLMNPAPYHNEPGFEHDRSPGDADNYSDCIRHETIRVAVCGMMEQPTCGLFFRKELRQNFLKWFPIYQETCKKFMDKDGTAMKDPFGEDRGTFQYGQLLERLGKILLVSEKEEGETDEGEGVGDETRKREAKVEEKSL